MQINTVYEGDAQSVMNSKLEEKSVDIILTSPPYNTSRAKAKDKHNSRYDVYVDSLPEQEYIDWTINVFLGYDKVLKKNGVVLYNLSYSTQNPALMTLVMADIIRNTPFTVVEYVYWKKRKATPNNRSHNRFTRIVEPIYVLCRKGEEKTFRANKKVTGYTKKGQKNYANEYNFIEAANNDGSNAYNKATFSSELVMRLLDMYAPSEFSLVYDSFMGTGTTAKAVLRKNMFYVGSELSSAQVKQLGTSKNILSIEERRNYIIKVIQNLPD